MTSTDLIVIHKVKPFIITKSPMRMVKEKMREKVEVERLLQMMKTTTTMKTILSNCISLFQV